MKNVVIPSANQVPSSFGTFSELPMCLLPVNGEPLLNYLLKKYQDANVVIVSCRNSQLIDEYLDSFSPIDVKNVRKSSLGNLGSSILFGLRALPASSETAVINFGDTLVSDPMPPGDCIFYSEGAGINQKWTYLEEENGVITRIVDKKSGRRIKGRLKLFVGLLSITDKSLMCGLLEKFGNKSNSFFLALAEYSRSHPFLFKPTTKWLDFGHPAEYFDAVTEIKSRAFNHIEIDKVRGIIRKTSDNESKLRKEISWYLKLPSDLQYAVPRLYDYSTKPGRTFVAMEYYSYHTLSDLFLYGDLDHTEWARIFQSIHFVQKDFARHSIPASEDTRLSLFEMYCKKTQERIGQLRNSRVFSPFFQKGPTINGVPFLPLKNVSEILDGLIRDRLLRPRRFSIIHGDYCFANILIDNNGNFIKLVDPRGEFGKYDVYGDARYDLAKLFHSVDGKYDYIIKDKFDLSKNGHSFRFSVKCNKDLVGLLCSSFDDMIESIDDIFLIESILFFTMIPLHQENLLHQYAMLLTGYEILNRIVDIREKKGGTTNA